MKSNRTVRADVFLAGLPVTQWSVVARAGNRNDQDWAAALNTIARAYRPVFLRHLEANLRIPPHHAEDLVQAFLSEKLLARNILQEARRARGRLRSFLLKAFQNDVISRIRRVSRRRANVK